MVGDCLDGTVVALGEALTAVPACGLTYYIKLINFGLPTRPRVARTEEVYVIRHRRRARPSNCALPRVAGMRDPAPRPRPFPASPGSGRKPLSAAGSATGVCCP